MKYQLAPRFGLSVEISLPLRNGRYIRTIFATIRYTGRKPEENRMATASHVKPVTFNEFCFLVKDGEKADLIDGVIYMASPENTDANDLFEWLNSLLYSFVHRRKLGKVYGSRVAFR